MPYLMPFLVHLLLCGGLLLTRCLLGRRLHLHSCLLLRRGLLGCSLLLRCGPRTISSQALKTSESANVINTKVAGVCICAH